jgi:hypothetical protein
VHPASRRRAVASASGIVIAEDGPAVLVLDRGIGGLAVAAFVTGLLGAIPLLFGLLVLLVGDAGSVPPGLGAVLAAVALLPLAATALVVRALRARLRRPLDALVPVAVFDRRAGVLYDGAGTPVAPLHQVQVHRRLQLGSSSPKLVASTPSGELLLGRPNPMAGGLGDLDHQLRAAVGLPPL